MFLHGKCPYIYITTLPTLSSYHTIYCCLMRQQKIDKSQGSLTNDLSHEPQECSPRHSPFYFPTFSLTYCICLCVCVCFLS